jgi:hypothetical protein
MANDKMPDAAAMLLKDLCAAYLRPVTGWDGATGAWIFDPPLTTAEQAVLSDLQTMARFGITADLTLAEFQAIKPQLAELRTFRTRTLAAWQALTATQREADEIGYLNDLTDVLRALLRS